jgi:hypothetical protein
MLNKTALWIAFALTVFVITVLGGVIYTVQGASQNQAAAVAPTNTDPTEATVGPDLAQAINDRETAYQKLVDEANARLAQAQQEQVVLQAQIDALTATQTPQPTQARITPQQAAQIAATYLGRTDLYSAETTSYNGATAYLVTFSSGDLVYVSMEGQVISAQPAPQQQNASTSRSGKTRTHHEENEDHDD